MTTTTNGHRALLLGWAALMALARGLAWLMVLAVVLAGLDGLLPRKAPTSNESMDSLMVTAAAAVAPMAHPLAQLATVQTVKGLRAMAREQGASDWRKASRSQLLASVYAIA